ncbi:ABC transporter ATP-binding protein [Spirochaeta africana]|uniref:ABC-type proline/glycine betaine transport system, ATPase component n=1 Tax=Spirochaeta africana (strain ATCC 700263 / DSM 8902 / Z-7692) TaxID=889378 RepID=H9UI41_SPIAZ|nr:ABC transporter ATP-binding protein [Spirochaeta africana]AFG37184.1 ABC-type proline/glycine betaine transport system, ATPase component [Spirochaeta africana DSM 8902]
MIELRNVSKRYGSVTALDGVSLVVPEGSVCVCIGPSGCGKSTTLKLVNRLLEPSDGEVLVNGQSVRSRSAVQLRREIGYVIQSVGLFPHMTVAENIGIVPRLFGRDAAWRRTRAEELLQLIGLDPGRYMQAYPAQLSGGEAQRIGVARALAANQPILLMDEPFGAVDPLNREVLQAEFLDLQRKLRKTILFVTHDLDEAIRMGDMIAIMNQGQVVQHDTPERILAQPASRFVADFVGVDRAIKRLVRFSVRDYLRPLPAAPSAGAAAAGAAAVNGRPETGTGAAAYGTGAAVAGTAATGSAAAASRDLLTGYHTLRDALSRLLSADLAHLPVYSLEGQQIGTVHLSDIRRITQEVAR